jgi:hypothetical protein
MLANSCIRPQALQTTMRTRPGDDFGSRFGPNTPLAAAVSALTYSSSPLQLGHFDALTHTSLASNAMV